MFGAYEDPRNMALARQLRARGQPMQGRGMELGGQPVSDDRMSQMAQMLRQGNPGMSGGEAPPAMQRPDMFGGAMKGAVSGALMGGLPGAALGGAAGWLKSGGADKLKSLFKVL